MIPSLKSTLISTLLLSIPITLAYEGDLTHYLEDTPVVGSCGYTSSPNDDVVALSAAIMGRPANPNKNPKCGTKIGIWNPHQKTHNWATVVDTCEGCKAHDIDVSIGLFKKIAPGEHERGHDRQHGIDWGGPAVGG
ncbi:MAG: hypothetical protein LQ346_007720 [Caloplaca aetnensis]|nr:MAG: hypothetical protein LQ346_007720 [Caloplaca aetnensis]